MNKEKVTYFPSINNIKVAADTIKKVSAVTPLSPSVRYSKQFDANILLKREDFQQVLSYKIWGAYNKISSLTESESKNGVVCVSAGNHAQGIALSCKLLKIKGTIYMPTPMPNQKIAQVKMFDEKYIKIKLFGDT